MGNHSCGYIMLHKTVLLEVLIFTHLPVPKPHFLVSITAATYFWVPISTLASSSCYNKVAYFGWLINRNLFLTFLEGRSL